RDPLEAIPVSGTGGIATVIGLDVEGKSARDAAGFPGDRPGQTVVANQDGRRGDSHGTHDDVRARVADVHAGIAAVGEINVMRRSRDEVVKENTVREAFYVHALDSGNSSVG